MAIARIASQDATGTSAAATVSATYAATPTSGNLLLAAVQGHVGGSAATITGWTQAVNKPDSAATAAITILYKVALGSESTTVSAAGAGNTDMAIAVYEYNGFSGTPTLDKIASANATSSSISTGTTATTTVANELLIAAGEMNSISTLTSWSNSFTTRNTVPNTVSTLFVADQIVSATGAYTTTATVSGSTRNAGAIATFKDVGGVVALPPGKLFGTETSPTSTTIQAVNRANRY